MFVLRRSTGPMADLHRPTCPSARTSVRTGDATADHCEYDKLSLFSTPQQLEKLQRVLFMCLRLPFAEGTIPGSVLEEVFATVRRGEVLKTYDFVDVISVEEACGWQLKSTREATPVTWKRAKLPNAPELINESKASPAACQELGDAIIALCNEHAQRSLTDYDLREIGYVRLILHDTGAVTYFERSLCSASKPNIFDPKDFSWEWSTPKSTVKKEQLPALHGTHRRENKKWWAWHGQGENQLHFSGESAWWPTTDAHSFTFKMPSTDEKLTVDRLLAILDQIDSGQ